MPVLVLGSHDLLPLVQFADGDQGTRGGQDLRARSERLPADLRVGLKEPAKQHDADAGNIRPGTPG